MTKSQIPRQSIPTTKFALKSPLKSIPGFVIVLVTGVVIVLIALIYNALFPKGVWLPYELDQNQSKWKNQNMTHYQMTISILGYGFDDDRMPLTVEVNKGEIESVIDSFGNNLSPTNDSNLRFLYPNTLTIPGLFSYIHKKIWEKLPSIRVSYNSNNGYPEEIYVIPYPEPCCQGFTINVQDFQELSP